MAIIANTNPQTAAASARRFRCLVVELKRLKITSIEQLMAHGGPAFAEYPFSMLIEAIKTAKKESEPRSAKAVNKIMAGSEAWRPNEPEQWVEFEQMRLGPFQKVPIIFNNLELVWSPVELWLKFSKYHSYVVRHLISTLTNESYYVLDDLNMIEADGSPDYPLVRNTFSTIPRDTEDKLRRRTDKKPLTPMLQSICFL